MWTIVGWTEAHQYLRSSAANYGQKNEYLTTEEFLSNHHLGPKKKLLLLSSFFHYSNSEQTNRISAFKRKLKNLITDQGQLDIIYLSSASVYGLSDDPLIRFTETAPTAPLNRNGAEKTELEKWLVSLSKQHENTRLIVIRSAGFFGKRQYFANSRNFIDNLVDQANHHHSAKKLQVSDNGKQIRDFLYVFDLLNILNLLMKSPLSLVGNDQTTILNIATPQKYRICDLISITSIQPESISYTPSVRVPIHNALNTNLFQNYFSNYRLTTVEEYLYAQT